METKYPGRYQQEAVKSGPIQTAAPCQDFCDARKQLLSRVLILSTCGTASMPGTRTTLSNVVPSASEIGSVLQGGVILMEIEGDMWAGVDILREDSWPEVLRRY